MIRCYFFANAAAFALAIVVAAAPSYLSAQCQGSLGTFTLPDPSTTGAFQSTVDIDVNGDGTNDLQIRRSDPGGFGEILLEAVALGTTRIANLVTAGNAINVNANNGAVTLYNEDLMFGTFDDPVNNLPFLEIEVGGRDGFVQFTNLVAQSFGDVTIDVPERGVAAVGANNPVSDQCPSLQSPVPVSLVSFEAESLPAEAGIRLTWATASERDNAGFAIERAAGPGGAFVEVGYEQGGGTREALAEYTFTDLSAPRGSELYYRLRQLDYDGAGTVSPVRVVGALRESEAPRAISLLSTNVVSAGTPLQVQTGGGVKVLRLVDVLGRVRETLPAAGADVIDFPTSGLAAGLYYLDAVGGSAVTLPVSIR